MQLQTIKVKDAFASSTNPRGADGFKGAEFDELVASVKEKGVLVPVLVRAKGKKFEVIAGNRRLAAATEAGIEEIPAHVVEMTDEEAREAQIVENMQRKDVHPLEEAQAFKYLAERRGADVVEIAKRVGKSERYVRERLGLTNLSAQAEKLFRNGEMSLTVAIVISKCDVEKIQKEAVDRAKNGWGAENIKKFIGEQMYAHYGSKPWAQDEKLSELLGDTKRATLFDTDMEEVEDPAKHAKMMAAFIELEIQKQTEKGNKIVKISTSYGQPDTKGVLGRDEYKLLETAKERKDASEDILGIVVEGWQDQGRVFHISTHADDLRHSSGSTAHKLTPEEKQARKKEREKEAKKEAAKAAKLQEALKKIKFPLTKPQVKAVFELVMDRNGLNDFQPLCKKLGLEAIVEETEGYGGKMRKSRNYEKTIREWAEAEGEAGMLRAIVALHLPTWEDDVAKALKSL
jgi:ParB family chromosome partitioning protein